MTKIVKCTCESKYQDEKYGKGQRLANLTVKDKGRCTVCGKEH